MKNSWFLSLKRKLNQGQKNKEIDPEKEQVAIQVRKVLGSNDQGIILMMRG